MELSSIARAVGGGALIGLAASIALLGHGRIAGISGTLGRAIDADGGRGFRVPFLLGLVIAGAIASLFAPSAFGAPAANVQILAVAGLLVGAGTALGNGCTSGHGVCGISRFSSRSIVAVMTFMLTGGITVAIARAVA